MKNMFYNVIYMVVKFMDVEIDKITAKEYKKHLLIKYDNKPLFIQTIWLQLSQYGVPKEDKYHTTEESRRYIQLPLAIDDNFTNFIKSLDEYFSSDKFRLQYLTDKQSFNYTPIFKQGSEKYPPSF